MDLLTPDLRARLLANARAHHDAMQVGSAEPDPAPVVKYFNPVGAATWLATELDGDGDTLFGRSRPRVRRCAASVESLRRVADLGFGCPELGYFSLCEIAALRLPLGLVIERDLYFASAVPLSRWANTARHAGSIGQAAAILQPFEAHLCAGAATTTANADGVPAPDRDLLPPPVSG